MASGRDNHLTKSIGEYLVCAELCRRGYLATSFTGNVPDYDILAINEKCITVPIQVKAIKSTSWQLDAAKYLDITHGETGIQKLQGKKRFQNSKLICVFVKIAPEGRDEKDEFYLFRQRDLQNIIARGYRNWLKKCGGLRPRNPKTTHFAITPKELSEYCNNWDLLKKI